MLPIIDFFIKNIYAAPKQDSQFSFKLYKISQKSFKDNAEIYNVIKRLPTTGQPYDVYVMGNIAPTYINLLKQEYDWYRDSWINLSEDMVDRGVIIHAYDTNGIMYNRSKIYYSFIDQNSLVFAVLKDGWNNGSLIDTSHMYIHFYSNLYFNTDEFFSLPVSIGIDYITATVYSNVDKVDLQEWVIDNQLNGGMCFIYVNGFLFDRVTLDIANGSVVEIVYDQSVVSKEITPISNLRQFASTKFSSTRYLLTRDRVLNVMEYYDDTELYITTGNLANNNGLFYYRHSLDAMFMGTDKDYTLNSQYVNNMANYLSTVKAGAAQDKQIVLYARKNANNRPLVYSEMRLHELYKLPKDKQTSILDGSGSSITELRVENIENSPYFNIASNPNVFTLPKEIFMQAIGYNAVSYYFGFNYLVKGQSPNLPVAPLYQEPSTAYEYDLDGKMLGYYATTGTIYTCTNINTKYVEFIKGVTPAVYNDYYAPNATVTLSYDDYVVLSAVFQGEQRLADWIDITNTAQAVKSNNSIILNAPANHRVCVIYLNEPNIYDLTVDINQGFIYFPITQYRYVGNTASNTITSVYYSSIELFLNGYRLVEGLDFFMAYPYISICNKRYIDHTLSEQNIHIRCHGFSIDASGVNLQETRGFINNGVLSRNSVYDIRDDRVMSVYIDGKFYPRVGLLYAEEDNTVRVNDPLNGKPYVMSEPLISIKQVSGLDTMEWYRVAKAKDGRLRDFFTSTVPETPINDFNVIQTRHTLYSPLVSKIIVDLLENVIDPSTYNQPYDDSLIINLLDTSYKDLLPLDPTKQTLQPSLVDVHPHIGNTIIDVNIYQYRFLSNLLRILNTTNINLSGYLSITA